MSSMGKEYVNSTPGIDGTKTSRAAGEPVALFRLLRKSSYIFPVRALQMRSSQMNGGFFYFAANKFAARRLNLVENCRGFW